KGGEDFWEKGQLFHLKPSPLFRVYDHRYLPNILNGENTMNTVKRRMHSIHFQTAKRLVCKRFDS
ncbi:hypothetical protein HMPREF0653_02695, partial [Prevotella disiens JCM 6334 = ATCC 29426]